MAARNMRGIVGLALVVAGLVVRAVFVLLRPRGHPIAVAAEMGDSLFFLGYVALVVLIASFVVSVFAATSLTRRWMGWVGVVSAGAAMGLACLGIF